MNREQAIEKATIRAKKENTIYYVVRVKNENRYDVVKNFDLSIHVVSKKIEYDR